MKHIMIIIYDCMIINDMIDQAAETTIYKITRHPLIIPEHSACFMDSGSEPFMHSRILDYNPLNEFGINGKFVNFNMGLHIHML